VIRLNPPRWTVAPPGPSAPVPDMRGFVMSYLLTRFAVGVIGILLPAGLLLGEWAFVDGPVKLRGSVSSYYHSPMRDEFVGCLCVIGVLLIMHMAGNRNAEFKVSALAGLAVVGLAMFPTNRPDLPKGAPRCGSASPAPPDCAPFENKLGETHCAYVHYACTGVFFVGLLFLAWYFGHGEGQIGNSRAKWLHYACAGVILGMLGLIVVGHFATFRIGPFDPLYVAELLTIFAFGLSWIVKGWDILTLLRHPNTAQFTGN
jgi:hypothetical protein